VSPLPGIGSLCYRARMSTFLRAWLVAASAWLALVAPAARAQDADGWTPTAAPGAWESLGGPFQTLDGFAWYQTAVETPEAWDSAPAVFLVAGIDDADETFCNGVRIGATGSMPPNAATAWNQARAYTIPAGVLRPGEINTIAIRVHDSGGAGGLTGGMPLLVGPGDDVRPLSAWRVRAGDEGPWAAPAVTPALAALAVAAGMGADDPRLNRAVPVRGLTLWYDRPAGAWTEALPVGNGRLGAMVFGGVAEERIQLNEETIWAGPPFPTQREHGAEALAEARGLYFAGQPDKAEALLQAEALAPHISPRSYQPLGDLRLRFDGLGEVTAYRRSLSLDHGIASTAFVAGGSLYTRRVAASYPDGVIAVQLRTDAPGGMSFAVALDRPADFETEVLGEDGLAIRGRAQHNGEHPGVRYEGRLRVRVEDGAVRAAEGGLRVEGASQATILLTGATDYNIADPFTALERDPGGACETVLASAAARSTRDLLARHVRDHAGLMSRVELDLGEGASRLPTDQRLALVRAGRADPGLEALYFQYGRYLLIASSRGGDMPANLQGLWNDQMEAPWNADFHSNINLQMNYWPALVGNLADCHLPLIRFIEGTAKEGAKTAQYYFGAPGWTAYHTQNPWFETAPSHLPATAGPTCGAWLGLPHLGALPLHPGSRLPEAVLPAAARRGGVLRGGAGGGSQDEAPRHRALQLAGEQLRVYGSERQAADHLAVRRLHLRHADHARRARGHGRGGAAAGRGCGVRGKDGCDARAAGAHAGECRGPDHGVAGGLRGGGGAPPPQLAPVGPVSRHRDQPGHEGAV
jgi:hypothetical protein